MALFNNLPDKIFEPLASKNKRLYEISLLALYATYYTTTREAPTREEVVVTILDVLNASSDNWFVEDNEEVTDLDSKRILSDRARHICDRLIECGWLEKTQSGYLIILEFSTTALHLMKSLWKINEGVYERLEGVMQTLRSILLNLQSGSQGYTAALTQCVTHLGDIRISMRGTRTKMSQIRTNVFKIRGGPERFKFLMDSFITKVFEIDVRPMSGDRHPYRLRSQTMSVINGFLNDEVKMMQIGYEFAQDNFYEELTEGTTTEKIEAQEKGVEMAYKRFSEIKEELNAIEEIANSITELQAKLANIIQTQGLARMTYGNMNTEKLENIMSSFATLIGDKKTNDDLPVLIGEKPLHLCEQSLRTPNERRKSQTIALEEKPEDPVMVYRQRLSAAYHERINVTDANMLKFIDQLVGNEKTYLLNENSLHSIDDFIATSTLLKMAISQQVPPSIERKYTITCSQEADLITTDYMICPQIIINRIQEKRNAT